MQIDSILHMFDAEIGWEGTIGRYFFLRGAIGFAATFAASTEIGIPGRTIPSTMQPLVNAAQSFLSARYVEWGDTPVATASIGARAF
jgi:hypothetical protein